MKRSVIFALAITAFCKMQPVFAQQTFDAFKKMTPQQKAKMVTDSLNKIFSFSPFQYGKIYYTTLDAPQKADPIMKSDDSRFSKRQKMQALLADEEAKIKTILTAAQFALYQSKKEKLIAYYKTHWQSQIIIFNVPG